MFVDTVGCAYAKVSAYESLHKQVSQIGKRKRIVGGYEQVSTRIGCDGRTLEVTHMT